MHFLQFKPFSKHELIENLQKALPDYKIQNTFGTLQVRTSGFTVSGNVALKCDPSKGWIRTQTNYDYAYIYLFMMLPLGIYLLSRKQKTIALEQLVIAKLHDLLEKPNGSNT
ncbi:MAG: hypothetical protein ACTHYC_04465 [Sphingobacterium sp.]